MVGRPDDGDDLEKIKSHCRHSSLSSYEISSVFSNLASPKAYCSVLYGNSTLRGPKNSLQSLSHNVKSTGKSAGAVDKTRQGRGGSRPVSTAS